MFGINLDSDQANLDQAISQYGLAYPQIYDGGNQIISSLYRVFGVPMSYLIDHEGIIRGKGLRGEMLREAIEALLFERP